MVIFQSNQIRIFNGKGYDTEKLLLLKHFNNYSINKWLSLVTKINIKLNINLNFNYLILFLFQKFFIKFLKFNKKLFFSYQKLGLTLNFLNLIKIIFFFNNDIFLEIFKFNSKSFATKNLNKGLYKKEFHKFLDSSFIPKQFLSRILDNRFRLRQLDYQKPLKNISLKIENLNNNNIYVSGQVFDYYRGSITPFYNSKYSWFASTGLKADVECHDLEVDTIINKEAYLNMYIDPFKDIIFKLRSFKFKVTTHIKNKARHIFFYNLHNFYGLQRFFSESNSSFNYKQNYYQLFNIHFSLFYLKSSIIFKKLFFNTVTFNNNLHHFKNIQNNFFKYAYTTNIYLSLNKLNFFLFKIMDKTYSYYNYIKGEIKHLSNSTEIIYRSLFSFINIEKISFFTLKVLLTNFNKILNIFLSVFLIFNRFLKSLYKYLNKQEVLRLFFDIFLIEKYKISLKKSLYKTISVYDKINIRISLLKKKYWFFMYKNFLYYMFFFLEWKVNLKKLISLNANTNIAFFLVEEKLIESFVKLKDKRFLSKFLYLKKFYFFFLEFFNKLLLNFKKIFYFSKNFLKNKKFFSYKFYLTNIYIFLFNRRKQEFLGNDLLLSNTVNFISNFLGQWFYYRQKQFFSDNRIDNFYSKLKPNRAVGFNLLESNIYNLNCGEVTSNYKLDVYFKENINKSYNIHLSTFLKKYKSKILLQKSSLISNMYSRLFKVRNFFFVRNLNKIVDNSLRSLFNLKLPKSLLKVGYKFYKPKTKGDTFMDVILKKKLIFLLRKDKSFKVNFKKKDISFLNNFLVLYENTNNLANTCNYFYSWLSQL